MNTQTLTQLVSKRRAGWLAGPGGARLALVALGCVMPPRLAAATFTVTSNDDSGPGSLREAIDDLAMDGDTINFAVTGTIPLTSGELVISRNVTIAGPGPALLAIDGNQLQRIFSVLEETVVTISGLTLQNGRGTFGEFFDGGGAVKNHGTLTLSQVVVKDSQSPEFGGGIINWGVLDLVDSTVRDNYAAPAPSGDGPGGGYGGGVYNGYNHIYQAAARARIIRCTIRGNSCHDSGGGIFNGGELEILDSDVSGNLATNTYFKEDGSGDDVTYGGYGGGIYLGGTVRVTSTRFSANAAAVAGGGIYTAGGSLDIAGTLVEDNSAPEGGGLYNQAVLQVTGSAFISNSAFEEEGGGIFNRSAGPAQIVNSFISQNVAGNGGGIANHGGLLEISASTIQGNQAQASPEFFPSGQGGGIYNGAADLRVLNCTVAGNAATEGAGLYHGGFFFASDSGPQQAYTAQLLNSTFSGNSAAFGGTLYSERRLYNDALGTVRSRIGSTILDAGASGGNLVNDSATVLSLGFNLSSDDAAGLLTAVGDQINTSPMLGPLQDNGGPTLTHAPLCASPALDAGKNLGALATDQRDTGFARLFDDPAHGNAAGGDGTDIGAVERQTGCDQPVTLVSIAVTPTDASVVAGQTRQFTATGNYSDGSTADLTSTATWQSSDSAVATVNSAGLASGLAAGSATITASHDGKSGSATLVVTALEDLDGNGCVDRADLDLLLRALRSRSTDPRFDLNGDGRVNVADARRLALKFTNPGGVPCAL